MFYVRFYISRYHFSLIQHYLKKIFLSQIFLFLTDSFNPPSPNPLNNQSLLSMTKVFGQCSLNVIKLFCWCSLVGWYTYFLELSYLQQVRFWIIKEKNYCQNKTGQFALSCFGNNFFLSSNTTFKFTFTYQITCLMAQELIQILFISWPLLGNIG